MRDYIRFLLPVAFLIQAISVFSQSDRLELDLPNNPGTIDILPVSDKGVLVLYDSDRKQHKVESWNFLYYDTSFNQKWTLALQVPEGMSYVTRYYDMNENIYILYQHKANYKILKLNTQTGENEFTSGMMERDFQIKDFKVYDDYAYLAGNIAPSEASVLSKSCLVFICFPLAFLPNMVPDKSALLNVVNLNTKIARSVPFNYKGYSEVSHVQPDTVNMINTAIIENIIGSKTLLYLHEYRRTGVRSKLVPIKSPRTEFQLLTARTANSFDEDQMVAGTYSTGRASVASGFYMGKIVQTKLQNMQFVDFSQIRSFYSILEKEGYIKHKKKNKYHLQANFKFLLHDLMIDSSSVMLIAEAYYPVYHTEFRTTYINGFPNTTSYQVFDGYKFTHMVGVKFGNNGHVIESFAQGMNHPLTFSLEPKVKVFDTGKEILILSSSNGVPHVTMIGKDQNEVTADLKNLNERIAEWAKTSGASFWYQNHLLLYGGVRSQGTNDDGDRVKRNMLILQKISYEPSSH